MDCHKQMRVVRVGTIKKLAPGLLQGLPFATGFFTPRLFGKGFSRAFIHQPFAHPATGRSAPKLNGLQSTAIMLYESVSAV